jgi:hypothetical protein
MNYNKKIGELGSESLENPKTTQNKEINVLSNEETMPPARPRINKKNVTQKNKK